MTNKFYNSSPYFLYSNTNCNVSYIDLKHNVHSNYMDAFSSTEINNINEYTVPSIKAALMYGYYKINTSKISTTYLSASLNVTRNIKLNNSSVYYFKYNCELIRTGFYDEQAFILEFLTSSHEIIELESFLMKL